MRLGQVRYVTACQRALALAVVTAVLAPAASVVSLDITPPGSGSGPPAEASESGAASAVPVARVETEPVTPVVTEQPLTAEGGAPGRGVASLSPVRTTRGGDERVVGDPEPADGFRTVGVTWDETERVEEGELTVEVRTRDHEGGWSTWSELEYHDDHAPDAGSREARRARPGTEPLVLGEVDDVQVRATGDVPSDLTLSLVDPGDSTDTEIAPAAIDTGALTESAALVAAPAPTGADAVLSAGSFTPKPRIFSRAQWGADERLRDPRSLTYHEVHAAFAHHTVNGNSYTRAQVPGILRSIYAYHTRSRGWSDVGYNFLVDKFGRVWEGRYGGVDRPVVGAHTLGYNHESFAMSAIGNFETAPPPQAMLRAYGRLFAWKLSLHGIAADDASVRVAGRGFRAINGHRDAGSTACPGRYLYARLPAIRSLAAEMQQDFSGRERETDLTGSAHPDIVLRRASDKQIFLLPTGGLTRFAKRRPAATGWSGTTPVASPDLDGDGNGDAIATDGETGVLWSGDGTGGFERTRTIRALDGKDLLAAVGDLDGDGKNDLVGRAGDGTAHALLGNGSGGFAATSLDARWSALRLVAGAGDVTGDGRVDLVARHADGGLRLLRGTASGRFAAATVIAGRWDDVTDVTGLGDYNRDGRSDLFARGPGGAGWVYPGRGDGSFARRFGPVRRVKGLAGLSGADVVGTEAPDLLGVVGNTLMMARNTGRFDASRPTPTGLSLPGANLLLNVGDWDRDGDGDLVTRHRRNGRLRLHPGDGRGGFGAARVIGSGFVGVRLLASVGDATGDGYPDLMGQPRGGAMRLYPGGGAGGLSSDYVAHSAVAGWRQVGFGRWDDDGAPDSLVRTRNRLMLYPGNGPGGLDSPRTLDLDVRPFDWFVGLGDVERRNRPDIAVRERSTGVLWLLRGTAAGFAPRRFLAEGMGAYDMHGR